MSRIKRYAEELYGDDWDIKLEDEEPEPKPQVTRRMLNKDWSYYEASF